MGIFSALALLAVAISPSLGHGAPETAAALQRREAFVAEHAPILQRSCAAKIKSRADIDRRETKLKRFVDSYLLSRGLEPNFQSKRAAEAACVLSPEQEEGPYYVAGELIREDIRETQPGVDLLIDLQVLNVKTCEPLPNVMVDFWHANSTGVYGGVAAEKTSGLTFERGLQASDSDGIVQVPGWYGGRAQHVHIKAHVNYTISNNMISAAPGKVIHTGQLFFQQAILSQVNVLSPYSTNKQSFTQNSADRVLNDQALSTAGYDPYLEVTLTGSTVSGGLVGTATVALDPWTGGK